MNVELKQDNDNGSINPSEKINIWSLAMIVVLVPYPRLRIPTLFVECDFFYLAQPLINVYGTDAA